MEMDVVYEWIIRGVLGVAFFMAAVVVIFLLLVAISVVPYHTGRLRRRLRLRRATTTTTTAAPARVPPPPPSAALVEKLLDTIPDVEYLPAVGAGAGDGDSDRESCVICVTPYEAGEACSILPACRHLFHKACVAKWLRVRCTCPLCRAAVALPPLLPHPHPVLRGNLNAAEIMV